MRPDGKPFDGPVITTGGSTGGSAAPGASPSSSAASGAQGGKASPGTARIAGQPREGRDRNAGQGYEVRVRKPAIVHVLAVVAIAALGIVPLALMMKTSIQDRLDKVALTITAPTQVNVIDGTSVTYLAGMLAVLLGVALGYRTVLRRRR